MSVQSDYDALAKIVEGSREDVEKANAGNKAACTRLRKSMQEAKAQIAIVRESALVVSKGDSAKGE